MRHLSVPSKQTAHWRQYLASQGWLASGFGIHNLDTMRAIPLNDNAPDKIELFTIIELDPLQPGPKHWTDRLEKQLFDLHPKLWPQSHDQIGDIIILKIPETLIPFQGAIGQAILDQHQNARVVCADGGVQGEFRVRALEVIASRDDSTSTQTKVREHGHQFIVDPSKAYYSPRLATERLNTLQVAIGLKENLGRPIDVCDPYAGVGPGLIPLANSAGLCNSITAADLNPGAIELLKQNLAGHWVECRDARELSKERPECADLLLVNLPHDSIEHLPHLIPLLKANSKSIIRAWAILDQSTLIEIEQKIREILSKVELISLNLTPVKSYSPSDAYTCIEIHIMGHSHQ